MSTVQLRVTNYGTEWFIYGKANTPEEKEALKKAIVGANYILGILKSIIVARKKAIGNVKESVYATDNWAYLTAHRNGRHEELDHMLNLLSKTEESTNDRPANAE